VRSTPLIPLYQGALLLASLFVRNAHEVWGCGADGVWKSKGNAILTARIAERCRIMKRFIVVLFCIFYMHSLYPIIIEYKNSSERDRLYPIQIEGNNYYSVNELRRVLNTSNHFIDYEHNKLNFTIHGETVVLYLNTFFVSFGGKLSNLSYPIIQRQGDFLVPETFFTHTLIECFPSKFSFDRATKTLLTEKTVEKRIRTIVIDPGHGGRDPGAVGRKSKESEIVLEIAKKLQRKIEAELDVRVLLTRTNGDNVTLRDRAKFANENSGDLFISLHTNAHQNRSAHGIEVFFLSVARNDDERAVEQMENQVVIEFEGGSEAIHAYDDLKFILADLLQSGQLEESSDLAVRLQTELVKKTGARDRGVKQAGFLVLRGAYMPAVLVELGFITNEREEANLMSASYQDKIVDAFVDALRSFKLKYEYLW
jgi:N-acetylmuramoyl-L-alanine amidase